MKAVPALFCILLSTNFAAAQISPEEAEARLRARQSERQAATTQPVSLLNKENKSLKEQLSTTTAECEKLATQLTEARNSMTALEAKIAELNNRLKEANEAIAALKNGTQPAKRPPSTKPAVDEKIAKALRERRPEVGMTAAQWRELTHDDGPFFNTQLSGSDGRVEHWLFWASGAFGTGAAYEVDMVDGKVTRWHATHAP